MQYHWNRHYSHIVNIVFLNNLVKKKLSFAFSSSLGTNGPPLGWVSLDRFCKSGHTVRPFLPFLQLGILISRVIGCAHLDARIYDFYTTGIPLGSSSQETQRRQRLKKENSERTLADEILRGGMYESFRRRKSFFHGFLRKQYNK